MAFSLWNAILLDWVSEKIGFIFSILNIIYAKLTILTKNNFFCANKVNSTGFLVQNYENLSDTDIDAFYRAFVAQINSTNTQILNAQQFVKGMTFFLFGPAA